MHSGNPADTVGFVNETPALTPRMEAMLQELASGDWSTIYRFHAGTVAALLRRGLIERSEISIVSRYSPATGRTTTTSDYAVRIAR